MERLVLVTENYMNELLETLSLRPYKEVATLFAKLGQSVKPYEVPTENAPTEIAP